MAIEAVHGISALREVRDRALLLSLGNAYLCEPVFLKKIGGELEYALGVLRDDILKIKKKFPGKFTQEINTDSILDTMQEMARKLKRADKKVQEQCTVGKFGRDLEDRVRTLSEAVADMRRRVEGGTQPYSGKEAVAGAVSRVGRRFEGGLGFVGRIITLTLVLLLIGFLYLFITMERPGGISNDIAETEARIQVLENELAGIQDEMRPIERQLKDLEGKTFSRKSKVQWMELRVELKKIEEKAQVVEGDLAIQRTELSKARERLQSIKEKNFLERLFRVKDN